MTGAERDRDIDGRARQARPRDALGRPLPYGAEGVEPVSEEALPPNEALNKARELIAAGRPFAAHEVPAFADFPEAHWRKIWSTNPLERLNKKSNGAPTLWGSSCVIF